ncbi:mycofactocin system transcriptional regulator [Compostimonas suwonensis]|uniref:Mycofactocin system transcriptional regulator n=1 Tax=Compostimonas suwonensis TaxID=1048394 RepID=A0A2M9BB70_9MICO|nr:mycofactocin system transcriptional regulator [Compostimonas suwonensis]PJJ55186.1 mycofactocin system transcriptional regulator [Compostimonas suwonensis]
MPSDEPDDAQRAAPLARIGRQPSTSHAELSHVALQLFIEHGFDNTTVDDIAASAGIGRRTFFRYFPSKNDLPWGDFETLLDRMRVFLRELPADMPVVDALCTAVIEFNRFPLEEVPYHRQRMELLLNVPSLMAHSTLRYTAWRQVLAEYVAGRLDVPVDSLRPQTLAWAFLAVSLSAYEQWLKHDDADLIQLLSEAFRMLDTAFDRQEHSLPPASPPSPPGP